MREQLTGVIYQRSYAEHVADNATACRNRERLALERAIQLLCRAEAAGASSQEADHALDFAGRLWKAFVRCGEKIYINGAVLRVDRKVSLELLNDATFLLEAHVMKVEDATTPLRQLYFIIQIMLMNPHDMVKARAMCESAIQMTIAASGNAVLAAGLRGVQALVDGNRAFDAL